MSNTLTSGRYRFVPTRNACPESKWFFGLDLGQRLDHSALAALELVWSPIGQCKVTYEFQFQPAVHIRSLKRFPIGTSYERL